MFEDVLLRDALAGGDAVLVFGEVLDTIVEVVLVGGEPFELPAHGVDERQLDIEGIRLIEEVGLGLFGEDVGLIGRGFDDGHVEIGLVKLGVGEGGVGKTQLHGRDEEGEEEKELLHGFECWVFDGV